MRAWNLLVKDRKTVEEILLAYRHHVCFAVTAKTVKKVKVGDEIILHNFYGVHMYVDKVVTSKKVVKRDNGEKVIMLRFL